MSKFSVKFAVFLIIGILFVIFVLYKVSSQENFSFLAAFNKTSQQPAVQNMLFTLLESGSFSGLEDYARKENTKSLEKIEKFALSCWEGVSLQIFSPVSMRTRELSSSQVTSFCSALAKESLAMKSIVLALEALRENSKSKAFFSYYGETIIFEKVSEPEAKEIAQIDKMGPEDEEELRYKFDSFEEKEEFCLRKKGDSKVWCIRSGRNPSYPLERRIFFKIEDILGFKHERSSRF